MLTPEDRMPYAVATVFRKIMQSIWPMGGITAKGVFLGSGSLFW